VDGVATFEYLGCTLAMDLKWKDTVGPRLEKAMGRFVQMRKLWAASNLSRKLKLQLFRAVVCSTMLHGCEVWPVEEKMLTFVNSQTAKMLAIVTKSTPKEQTSKPSLPIIAQYFQRRHAFLGHVLRLPDHRILKRVILLQAQAGPPYPAYSLFYKWSMTIEKIEQFANERITWRKAKSPAEESFKGRYGL